MTSRLCVAYGSGRVSIETMMVAVKKIPWQNGRRITVIGVAVKLHIYFVRYFLDLE